MTLIDDTKKLNSNESQKNAIPEKLRYESRRIDWLVAQVDEMQDELTKQGRLLRELRDDIARLKWRLTDRT
ncbi:MAG: hypothetical protein HRF40_11450 [Nitrososphaera sp.]